MRIKFKMIYVPITIMLLIGTLMIGLTDYITAEFSIDRFTEASFWANIVTNNVGILCIIISILLIRNDAYKESNIDYLDTLEKIVTFRNTRYESPIFSKFCAEQNLILKKEKFKERLQKKFSRVKPTAEDLRIFFSDDEVAKLDNKYCKKVRAHERYLSDEYINKTVPMMRIRHNVITPSLVFSGTSSDSYKKDWITQNVFKKVARDITPKYLLSFSIICMTAVLVTDFRDGITLSALFTTAVKLFTVCSQIYYAYNYADKFNIEVTLHDANFRYDIISNYCLWEKNLLKQIKQTESEVS